MHESLFHKRGTRSKLRTLQQGLICHFFPGSMEYTHLGAADD